MRNMAGAQVIHSRWLARPSHVEAAISFATDKVLQDGITMALASISGNATDGYVATLTVNISA